MSNELKLFLGCGPLPIHPQHLQIVDDTWTFIDLYVHDPKIVQMDIRKLGYADESVSRIYCSHALEHLGSVEAVNALQEWYRVLKSGGDLIINVPDIEWAIDEYINLREGKEPQSKTFTTKQKLMEVIYGNQTHEGEFHKSGYNEKGLEKLLQEVGFKDVTVKKIYEAHDMGCLVATAKK